jgi:hypothetical protein
VASTDAKIAKENRIRLFREQAENAMKEVVQEGVSIRKNMARLRALRLAKEAEAAALPQTGSEAKRARRKLPANP